MQFPMKGKIGTADDERFPLVHRRIKQNQG